METIYRSIEEMIQPYEKIYNNIIIEANEKICEILQLIPPKHSIHTEKYTIIHNDEDAKICVHQKCLEVKGLHITSDTKTIIEIHPYLEDIYRLAKAYNELIKENETIQRLLEKADFLEKYGIAKGLYRKVYGEITKILEEPRILC